MQIIDCFRLNHTALGRNFRAISRENTAPVVVASGLNGDTLQQLPKSIKYVTTNVISMPYMDGEKESITVATTTLHVSATLLLILVLFCVYRG